MLCPTTPEMVVVLRTAPEKEKHLRRRAAGKAGRAAAPCLFEAAGIVLNRVPRWSASKAWETRLVKKIGGEKATVANDPTRTTSR